MAQSQDLPTVAGSATLGGIVAERPETAALFERFGLDYCCGGRQTVEEACRSRGFNPTTVAAILAALEEDIPAGSLAVHDLRDASVDELCEHILKEHHGPLRENLRRISQLLAKVICAHGDEDPDLYQLEIHFNRTRSKLEDHMRVEEESLFPACRALARDDEFRADDELLAQLEDTHAATGEALRRLRGLGHGYRAETAYCTTHRVLLHELDRFERDLHLHIHEENNILFPKVHTREG
ncbi:MAG: DUF542 domain-containing protein [Solirubrobacterales bacterium]